MEINSGTDHDQEQQKNLIINELRHGRELAKQLQVHLNVPCSPHEARELLVHKILCSYDKALSMLNYSSGNGNGNENENRGGNYIAAAGDDQPVPQVITRMGTSGGRSDHESPARSFSGSPRSEDSDREFKDLAAEQKDASTRKRKSSMQRWTKQVQIRPGGGLEGPLDDGFSWRKYGQKDILGEKFPRGYYRCTHRMVQGCLATKQVQRSDDDPTIFEITYRGEHTCTLGGHQSLQPPLPAPPGNQQPTPAEHQPPQSSHPQTPDMLLNFQTGLKVITTENLDSTTTPPEPQYSLPNSFHFGSTSNHDAVNYSSAVPPFVILNNDFPVANYSPPFVPPATSESNIYFSASPRPASNFRASDCELSEVVSGATSSANNSTTKTTTTAVGILGFPFGQMEFDHNFTFDNPSFLS